MSNAWRIERLGDLLGNKGYIRGPFGSALRRNELLDEGIPVYEQQHAIEGIREFRYFINETKHEALKRFTIRPHDLIMSCSGTIGRVSIIEDTDPVGIISQALLIFRPDTSKLLPGYLRYFITSATGMNAITSRSTGSVQVNIAKREIIENIELLVPPLREQRAIAGVLGALDDKIEQNRRTAAKLEELARATFRAWFVDFAPVHAKIAGQTGYPGLPPAAFAALPTSFVESPVGPIPEGWTCEPLDALANIVGGGTPKRSNEAFWGNDVPWYSVKDAPDSGQAWVVNTTESISQAGLDGSSARVLPEAATIISARGTVGRLALAGVPMAFNQSCYGLVETEKALPFTLYQALHLAVAELQRRTHGAVFDTITRQTFSGVELAWPPLSLVDAMELFLQPLYLSMRHHLQESHHLAALRDYLLPRLLSGEVRVQETTIEKGE